MIEETVTKVSKISVALADLEAVLSLLGVAALAALAWLSGPADCAGGQREAERMIPEREPDDSVHIGSFEDDDDEWPR